MLLKLLHEKLPEIERIGIEAEERGKKLGIKPSWPEGYPSLKEVRDRHIHRLAKKSRKIERPKSERVKSKVVL
ncbi:hypothetical protein [Agrobacterium tumefaciens]|uniref:hypothetical protein n=1 Tax=Agrobacterium tumefaciens TaxID=358 RepID=UPI001573521B|nr:hypothetical protein [Agrobacterium tumefaciens]